MATAQIQINAETAGQSVLGLPSDAPVTLTDAGGAGALSWEWEILIGPAPANPLPTVSDSTSQVATVNPPGGSFVDGLYIVRLIRNDPLDGLSVDTLVFGIPDEDGLHLPTAGVNRNLLNVGASPEAQKAGWMGSDLAGTNTLLDAYLRLRKEREERTFVVNTAGVEPYAPVLHARNHPVLLCTGVTKTVNLPPAVTDAKFTIIDGAGDATSTPIDVNANVGENISGSPSVALVFNYEAVTLIGVTGLGWFILSRGLMGPRVS